MPKNASLRYKAKSTDCSDVDTLQAPQKEKLHVSIIMRGVYIALAVVCLILAVLGIVLPGVPTFDFLFLATFFAAKGSAKLHRWIHQNRYIHLLLTQYTGGFKSISRLRKYMMTLTIVLILISLILSSLHLHIKLSFILILLVLVLWIWSRAKKIEI
ncbi:hypothetical protein F901_02871 [Acinetobacter dispersus]|uniref:YbaN family protein n=1 Tax=Acinetobacter dispersus TaxID=70348 RepID=UPI0002CF09A9|nr:YbaN family protein [Acinetobacter dispersus]ENX51683.1 hypothetical protein F901_02871 [Acinetobacter dispersus]